MGENLELPLVSFIVITHNFEKFVSDCLESIKNQTYKKLEIIVVDDTSKDNTAGVVRDFMNANPELNVRLIQNEANKGQLGSFLEGLKYANGVFVCQIDGDDMLFPEYCAIHVETHLKTPVALTSCNKIEIDGNNIIHTLYSCENPIKPDKNFKIENKTFEEFEKYRIMQGINKEGAAVKLLDCDKYGFASWHWGSATSGMMRKSVCDMLLLIEKTRKLKITADKFLFSFCHLIGSSAVIDKVLFAYRRHSSNYSQANPVTGNKKYYGEKTQNSYIRNNKKIRQQMFNFIKENNDYFLERFNRFNLLMLYKRIVFSFDKKFIKGLIKSLFV